MITGSGRGLSRARNAAIAKISTEWAVFVDDVKVGKQAVF